MGESERRGNLDERPLERERQPLRVLVTGAAGFVGLPVLRELLRNPEHRILGLEMRDPPFRNPQLEWLRLEPGTLTPPVDSIAAFRPNVVIHLAWEGIPDFSSEQSFRNLQSSVALFRMLWSLECVSKVVVSGTCFEYDHPEGACAETRPTRPKDYFTWAKHALREYLELACVERGVTLNWMRIFYVYGPRQRTGSLIPAILRELREGKLPAIHAPKNANDFVHVIDVADGFVRAAEGNVPFGIYNLGSGHATQVLEICRVAERVALGTDTLTAALEAAAVGAPAGVGFWADSEKSRSVLGWTPRVSLWEGIRGMWGEPE